MTTRKPPTPKQLVDEIGRLNDIIGPMRSENARLKAQVRTARYVVEMQQNLINALHIAIKDNCTFDVATAIALADYAHKTPF